MQSIRSASSGAISELKDLLELISDPKKAKAALDEISDALDELAVAEKDISEKTAKLTKLEKSQSDALANIEAAAKDVAEQEKIVLAKEQSFSSREAAVAAGEKALAQKQEDFGDVFENESEKLKAQANKLAKKEDELKNLLEQTRISKESFDKKQAQLKAITG